VGGSGAPAPRSLSLHDALPISSAGRTRVSYTDDLLAAVDPDQSETAYTYRTEVGYRLRFARVGARVEYRHRESVLSPTREYDRLDRKSTRLNSSHVKISYAVFC